jgi:uncharacterized radical SAM protein YgiQ
MDERGWDECDFIFVSGDAYIDHPSFAAAILCRTLEAEGFRVGIIPQPNWKDSSSFTVLGRPRLGFLAGAGNMDSMVAHYTAAKRKRSDDAYSPGGKSGHRPDRALLVYVEGIRRAYKDTAVIIGGIEASLRRFAHYDYWSDTVRRSILLDSKADILVYGMGEKTLLQIAHRLAAGEIISSINDVRGTCIRVHGKDALAKWKNIVFLPEYNTVKEKDAPSARAFAEHFMLQKDNADPLSAKPLAEQNDGDRMVIQNPPALPLSVSELDRIYELPFTRKAHPMYEAEGGIPALKEVSFSLVSSRGCFGGCSFCAITFHQGRTVTGRSKESLLREARAIVDGAKNKRSLRSQTANQDFKGYIHDVGGPTANFYQPACEKQKPSKAKASGGFCAKRECLFPSPCPKLKANHKPYIEVLNALRKIPGIKKVFIRSGIRFDFIQHDKKHGKEFLETLCQHHVSGQLKVAPEHISANVLKAMGKFAAKGSVEHSCYEQFRKNFADVNKRLGLKQYLLPYFISAHPGASIKEAWELSRYLKKTGFVPEQTQEFYPTPGTMSTVMYHTGLDPRTMKPVYVAKGNKERRLQKALLHLDKPENRKLVQSAMKELNSHFE